MILPQDPNRRGRGGVQKSTLKRHDTNGHSLVSSSSATGRVTWPENEDINYNRIQSEHSTSHIPPC